MNLEQEKLIAELQYLLSDQRGIDFLWRLLERAGIFRTSFHASEPLKMAFNEGRRDMGLFIIDLVLSHENGVYLMKLLGQTNERGNTNQWADNRDADTND